MKSIISKFRKKKKKFNNIIRILFPSTFFREKKISFLLNMENHPLVLETCFSDSDSDSSYSSSTSTSTSSEILDWNCVSCSTDRCGWIYCSKDTMCCLCTQLKDNGPLLTKQYYLCPNCLSRYFKKIGKCRFCFSECRILSVFDYKCCKCMGWSEETICEDCKEFSIK